jgi:2-polyprenyl-3-methyl-5-hydroxy-6-metoxy-1,4-benzoquinol methylase
MDDTAKEIPGGEAICPARHGPWLASSLRKLIHPPRQILRDLAHPGATVVDIGCGPGYFTLPLARLVGEHGLVVAADLQKTMLEQMLYRAARAKLLGRILPHRCAGETIGYAGPVDAILAFYMVHEVPKVAGFLNETWHMLRPAAGCCCRAKISVTAGVTRNVTLALRRVPQRGQPENSVQPVRPPGARRIPAPSSASLNQRMSCRPCPARS